MFKNKPKSQKGLFSFRISKKLYIVKKKKNYKKENILYYQLPTIKTFNYLVRINKT